MFIQEEKKKTLNLLSQSSWTKLFVKIWILSFKKLNQWNFLLLSHVNNNIVKITSFFVFWVVQMIPIPTWGQKDASSMHGLHSFLIRRLRCLSSVAISLNKTFFWVARSGLSSHEFIEERFAIHDIDFFIKAHS